MTMAAQNLSHIFRRLRNQDAFLFASKVNKASALQVKNKICQC